MKLRMMLTVALAATSLATLAAAPQNGTPPNEKQPIEASTGRFGDPTSVARKYQDYLYGVIKEVSPSELVLTKTKFGVDQSFKLNKKTKITVDGKPSSIDKLKAGEGVYIDIDTNKKTGEFIAKKVVSGVDVPTIPTAQ